MFRVQEKHYHDRPMLTESEEEAKNKRPPGVYRCPECRDTTIIWRTTVDKYKVKCAKCSSDMVLANPLPAPVVAPTVSVMPVAIKIANAAKLDEPAEQYDIKTWWTKMRAQSKYTSGLEAQLTAAKKQRRTVIREAAAAEKTPKVAKLSAQIALLEKSLGTFGKGPAAASQRLETSVRRRVYKLDVLAEIYKKDPQRARLEAAYAGVHFREVVLRYAKGTALTGLQLGMKHGQEEASGTRGAPNAIKLWLLQKLHGSSYVLGRQQGLGGKHGGTRSGVSIIDAVPALLKGISRG